MELTEINIYPVKSCAGVSVQSTHLDRFGPVGDRRWMVVQEGGDFVTQRDHPRMALIRTMPKAGALELAGAGTHIQVSEPAADAPGRHVRVWEDRVWAVDAGDNVARWLSAQLEMPCRLVHMPEDSVRMVDGVYASEGETVGFADGFPLLLISRSSLEDLNARLPQPVPMNRFRPNLVVAGCDAFAEDNWHRIRIGELEFDVAKACSRCVMPSIIQETAERDPHINRTLAGFRRNNGQVYFGQNLLYQQFGQLRVGDAVEIIS